MIENQIVMVKYSDLQKIHTIKMLIIQRIKLLEKSLIVKMVKKMKEQNLFAGKNTMELMKHGKFTFYENNYNDLYILYHV